MFSTIVTPTAILIRSLPPSRYSDADACPKDLCNAVQVSDFAALCSPKSRPIFCSEYVQSG